MKTHTTLRCAALNDLIWLTPAHRTLCQQAR
jgi:hypothetical protein